MDDLAKKYVGRIEEELSSKQNEPELSTRQYQNFKRQYLPKHLTVYEKACNACQKIFPMSPAEKDRKKIEEAIHICHLETTPEGVVSFSVIAPLIFILGMAILGFLMPMVIASSLGVSDPASYGSTFILLFSLVTGASLIIPLQRLPFYFANNWRMQASNQMVLCVFYIVTYMRHTSNLELAIDFSADRLAPPLSLDMKKIIWDVETEKYSAIKESLDEYLETWKEWNPEFIESLHLIEGSLLESSETRRIEMLDKALSVMLEETYEKMLHYAHNLKSPLTTLHMLGVILPILGLVILPLMVNFIPEVKWYHMAIVYNVALPGLVYVLAKNILSTRPTGYGNADITDLNPELQKFQDVIIPLGGKDEIRITPMYFSLLTIALFLIVGFFPVLYHITASDQDWIVDNRLNVRLVEMGSEEYNQAKFYFLNYREINPAEGAPYTSGPYGIGAVLLSLMLPLAFGLGIGMYYSLRSKDVIKIREQTRKLEEEFASALFQLGNRLADGLPAEIAFAKVAEVLEGTHTGRFFDLVTTNIIKLGMNIEQAIFDPKRGALLEYPSNIIESSMKVLIESSKKGPLIASQAVVNVSEYIKQMHRVDERLKDLMSDVISSMKAQISFLTPVIAGIVIGITTMMSSILGTIGTRLSDINSQAGDQQNVLFDLFGSGGIPTYHFQAIVGLYVVQITFILTIMVNGIENGVDELAEQEMLGKNLLRSTVLYVAISAITIIVFGMVAGQLQQF